MTAKATDSPDRDGSRRPPTLTPHELTRALARSYLPSRAVAAGERLRDAPPAESPAAVDAFRQEMLAQPAEVVKLMLLTYVAPLCVPPREHRPALAALIRLGMERHGLAAGDYLWSDCLKALGEGDER
jgi:hypothetical protein